ncbi:MAG: TlpA family protein disulfide reductase [Hyphomonadaceae bacterium]|nr:TlpA family protein disulfide reductase [Hyphomonadaceae bacterium]
MSTGAPGQSARRKAIIALGAAAMAAIAGFAAVYVTLGRPDNAVRPAKTAQSPAGPQAIPTGPGSNPLSQGEVAAFVFRKTPEVLPEVKFQDGAGRERTLADWRGKVVLLNLWATWCLPCRTEMPALDRLQKDMGSDKFEVVAVSVDRKGAAASKKFLDEIKVEHLALYVDATTRISADLRVVGLPATLLIDTEGREIGRMFGPAEWDGEDAKRLIRAALK